MSKSFELEVAEALMGRVEFVSYDGMYPNLCSGTLVVRVGNKRFSFDDHALRSGGGLDANYDPIIGDWDIDDDKWPEGLSKTLKADIVKLVNETISHGCCGGCS
jgi:hypothetical protein